MSERGTHNHFETPSGADTMLRHVDAKDLEVLLTVAETGSFRRAGEYLGVGQSAVSRRIQKLEDMIGVSFFERRTTGARLTLAGSEFVACSSAIFENLKAAVVRARSTAVAVEGKLRIGTISSFSNGSQRTILRQFVQKHPKVELCIVESDRRQMMAMLNHRTLDVVISVGRRAFGKEDNLLLTYSPAFLAVASDDIRAQAETIDWEEIADAIFLVSARESGPDIHDYIVRNATRFGRSARIARHQVSRDGILSLVGLGLGVTVVGDHAVGAHYPNVTFVRLGHKGERIPFSLAWLPENDNPALRRFISLARIEATQNGVLS